MAAIGGVSGALVSCLRGKAERQGAMLLPYQPQLLPLFCWSSHDLSGAK